VQLDCKEILLQVYYGDLWGTSGLNHLGHGIVNKSQEQIFYWPFSRTTHVSQYQNVFTLVFIEAEDDGSGGDNWSCKMCRASVRSSHQKTNIQLFTRWMTFLLPS